jgi:Protein of unknown function (DUF2917)
MDRKRWHDAGDEQVLLDGAALARRGLLSIRGGRGAVLFVDHGEVWVTQEGDRRDVVLTAGAWFRLDRDGTAILQARRAAAVTLTAAADALMPEIRTLPHGASRRTARRRGHPWLRALTALWLRMYRRAKLSIARRLAAAV